MSAQGGGSFLDLLLVAAAGQLKVSSVVTSGQSVVALPGQIVLADPSAGSPNVSAPSSPALGTFFGVADVTAQSAVHAINVLSSGGAFQLEIPATPGSYSNSVTIASASRVRVWCYVGSSPGWKIVYGAF